MAGFILKKGFVGELYQIRGSGLRIPTLAINGVPSLIVQYTKIVLKVPFFGDQEINGYFKSSKRPFIMFKKA